MAGVDSNTFVTYVCAPQVVIEAAQLPLFARVWDTLSGWCTPHTLHFLYPETAPPPASSTATLYSTMDINDIDTDEVPHTHKIMNVLLQHIKSIFFIYQ